MTHDYIVDDVRRLREEQAAKHGFDVMAILAAAKKRQRRSKRTVVSLIPKKTLGTTSRISARFQRADHVTYLSAAPSSGSNG